MSEKIDHAFILAAGKGTRMKPYTDYVPKPLVEVAGKSLIGHAIDKLEAAGIKHITVNLHYMADLLENHLRRRADAPHITIVREDILLETGGGIKNALHTMKGKPFFCVAGDSLWVDGEEPCRPALERMADVWDPEKMDMLFLLQPVERMTLTTGVGDYDLLPDGRAVRSRDRTGLFMWTSIRICKPEVFDESPDGPFSFLELMDRAEAEGRLYGLVHNGDWHHISTADDLENVNDALMAAKAYA